MNLISAESIRRPEVLRWHQRMRDRYSPPQDIGLTVLLPCSAKKPYSKSKSHRRFKSKIRKGAGRKYPLVHEVILTSPLGLVPRELENVYPAAHYDVPVTGEWSYEEKAITISLLKNYIKRSGTPVIAHVKGAYQEICEKAGVESVSGDIEFLEKMAIEKLEGKNIPAEYLGWRERMVRAVCDFQFGKGAHSHLLDVRAFIKGYQIKSEGDLIATVDRDSGLLALTLRGAEKLYGYGRYIVELSFKPETNSIFCVGIEDADPGIRPRDEVIAIYKSKVVGVGKAVLNGDEMKQTEKGLGINLRHRRKDT